MVKKQALSRLERFLVDRLKDRQQAVITPHDLFRLIQDVYRDGSTEKLSLKTASPGKSHYYRLYRSLCRARVIGGDDDYRQRALRILVAYDQPPEDVVCLADPLCHVSHLSAMQWWGLTDRIPKGTIFTRANASQSRIQLLEIMENDHRGLPPEPFRLRRIKHPESVRGCHIRMIDSKTTGNWLTVQGRRMRLAKIGQTFLDMLRRQDLCGGMRHVLDVYDQHAGQWIEEIVSAVEGFPDKIIKCRAGYILSERLNIRHEKINSWKASAPQRGGSCKLDSSRDYAPVYSEAWNLSLNV